MTETDPSDPIDPTDDIPEFYSDEEEDEPSCPSCGGPIYSQPHWSYFRCDDCGYTQKKAEMEP